MPLLGLLLYLYDPGQWRWLPHRIAPLRALGANFLTQASGAESLPWPSEALGAYFLTQASGAESLPCLQRHSWRISVIALAFKGSWRISVPWPSEALGAYSLTPALGVGFLCPGPLRASLFSLCSLSRSPLCSAFSALQGRIDPLPSSTPCGRVFCLVLPGANFAPRWVAPPVCLERARKVLHFDVDPRAGGVAALPHSVGSAVVADASASACRRSDAVSA